jgi:acyl-CoA synthetase (AMP-forming)/AMP-acid ligase II
MVVTAGGKNVYPEDVESSFAGLPVRDFCIMAASYVWAERGQVDERLIAVVRVDDAAGAVAGLVEDIRHRNRRLPEFKRIDGYVLWPDEFPRTTSLKIRRDLLAARLRETVDRQSGIVAL